MAAITRLVRRTSSISYLASNCLSTAVASETSSHAPPYNAPLFHPKPPRKDPKDRDVQWIFLGCPGVGKGTYASRLCDFLGVPHIATVDLVREELASSGHLSAQGNCAKPDELEEHLEYGRICLQSCKEY